MHLIANRSQQATWPAEAAGIGSRLLVVSELLCESVDLRAGERVLDVACGSGSTALAAARRCCQVVAVDDDPVQLQRARTRADAEGLEVTFLGADAGAFPDGSFDVVLSAGGGNLAPDQERTAAELLRVCRPGGRIGMVCWTPDGYVGKLFGAIGRYRPALAAQEASGRRGIAERLRELLGPRATITAPRCSFLWRFPSVEDQVEFLGAFHRPTVEALRALGPRDAGALEAEMVELARRFGVSEDGTLVLRMDYLEVVAHKPAWR